MLGQGSYMQPVFILQNEGNIVVNICLPCQARVDGFFSGENHLYGSVEMDSILELNDCEI
jgi:hypothetical protein